MGRRATDLSHIELAANGDDASAQLERVEDELREIHGRLDALLCAINALLHSPGLDPQLAGVLYDAIEPASEAILHGASRLRDHVRWRGVAGGW